MPVEIRELHIRATVNQPQPALAADAPPPQGEKAEDEKDSVIAQCVEEVLEIIKNKKER